jgi:outer membrane protein TolC
LNENIFTRFLICGTHVALFTYKMVMRAGKYFLTESIRIGMNKKNGQAFHRPHLVVRLIWIVTLILVGCQTPGSYRTEVEQKAQSIIIEKQAQVLGKKTDFSLEKPGDILRRQILEQASLPFTGPVSLGTDKLPLVAHWPEAGYPSAAATNPALDMNPWSTVSLVHALQIGAQNNFDYKTKKEAVFQAALALYLEQDGFRNSLIGQIQNIVISDRSTSPSREGNLISGKLTGTRLLESGTKLTTALAVDLATLLTGSNNSSFGIAGDASLSIPLLRGSGRHIITEPMQQAEQNLVYAILEFERFKKKLAVSVGKEYLVILKQLDRVKNAEEDYRSRMISARRSKRLADAGRLKEIEVDQSVQTELSARQRWVSAQEQYKKQMDAFKGLLGLPPDAEISLDPDEIKRISDVSGQNTIDPGKSNETGRDSSGESLPADAPIKLLAPDFRHAGPLEISATKAIELALENRLDLQVATGKVFDAQRAVVVAADALDAEFTLLGSASVGQRRTITTADLENAQLRTDKGVFSALLTLDLPFERTAEAVAYRNSFILLEQAVRNVQSLEDTIKIEVRSRLRELLEARETLQIQAKAVSLAQKRVKSINLFMDAGRAETRDLLEAQDALLEAQDSLTSARVNYRIAELEIQRDMGLLVVTDKGLWQEYSPEAEPNVKK